MLVVRKRSSAHGRQGTTLQEMLVVLAILVSLAGSAWPAMRGGLEKGELRSAAKMVRTELAKTRLAAIESGEALYFRFQPVTGKFEVAPVTALQQDQEVIDTVALEAEYDETPQLTEFDLPEGVVFSDPELKDRKKGGALHFETEEAEENGESELLSDGDDEQWSAPIVFFPNGRTSNAQIALQNEDGHHILVSLRGLTGSATIGELKKAEVEE